MNSLEFIDKEIKQLEERKENAFKNEYYSIYRECSHKIIALQQIKAELEAWYVLKPDLEHTENELGEHEIELRVFYTDADVEQHDTKEKYYTLKKALEVK